MPRRKRKQLKFDEESLNELLQEIYNDSHNIRAEIKSLFRKWEVKVKEDGHIAAFGDQVVKLISAEAKNQDQKIMLLKYLKEVVYTKTNPNKDDEKDQETLIKDRNELINMVSKELEKKKDK